MHGEGRLGCPGAQQHWIGCWPTEAPGMNPEIYDYNTSNDTFTNCDSYNNKGVQREIEKHFTNDNKRQGYDHRISLNYEEMKTMVKGIMQTENMLSKEVNFL